MTHDLDRHLETVLRDAVTPPPTDGVVAAVAARAQRRRRNRRLGTGAIAAALVAAIVAVGVSAWSDGRSTRVAAPGRPATPVVRIVAGDDLGAGAADDSDAAALTRVPALPADEVAHGPLLASGPTVAVVTSESSARGTAGPSRVLRVELPDGPVVDEAVVQGEVLALADGEGARWALARDREVLGPDDPRFRIKRLGVDGSVVSNPVPTSEVPTGSVVAGGGGVWLPVADGVLRFDPVSGAFASKHSLPAASERSVATVGKAVYVSGDDAVWRLDPASPAPVLVDELDGGGRIAGIAAGPDGTLVELVIARDGRARLEVPSTSRSTALPRMLDARTLRSVDGLVWVEGDLDGSRAIVVLDRRLRDVSQVASFDPEAVTEPTLTARDEVVALHDGALWRAPLD